MRIQPTVGKWQIGVSVYKPMEFYGAFGWFGFDFWCIKLIAVPEEGEVLWKKYYDGVRINFKFWVPFEK